MSIPKILSVDDSRMVHTLIGRSFANYDVNMVFASNGQEGLEVAAREKPDVILLDVTMPVMDGVECLGKLKADPSLKDIPVIMLTAEAGKENVLKIAKMGVRDYIVKPFTEPNVVERVSRLVDLKRKGASVADATNTAGKKQKTVTDALKILVVDEFPAIIESIAKAVAKRGWQVIGCPTPADASAHVAPTVPPDNTPDIILISLSYPNQAALAFFATVRANHVMKNVPLMGLCVKTATFEQNNAKDTGFVGSITKPLDLKELPDRLVRAMDLDNTPLFCSMMEDSLVVAIPEDLSEIASLDLVRYSRAKLSTLVNSGFNKLIMDLTGVKNFEIPILRSLSSILSEATTLDIAWRIVGSADDLFTLPTRILNNQKMTALKDIKNPFEGQTIIDVYPTRDAAKASF
jgi:two-component system cell cycle response regulator